MADESQKPSWERLLAGGFACGTASFAVHPKDKERAKAALSEAKEAGVSKQQFIDVARRYLESAVGFPTNVSDQLDRVEKFIGSKLH